jgi:hypothetical protein
VTTLGKGDDLGANKGGRVANFSGVGVFSHGIWIPRRHLIHISNAFKLAMELVRLGLRSSCQPTNRRTRTGPFRITLVRDTCERHL